MATPARSHVFVPPRDQDHMQAWVQDRYGSVEVLSLQRRDRPACGPNEVMVQVLAAGVDRGVLHLLTGHPYPVRLAGYGMLRPKTKVPGLDLAGIVTAVGANVTRLHPGDEVFGIGSGAYAEFAVAREDKLAHKPRRLTFEQAAALAISGTAALQALRDHGRVRPRQHVLVLGASGGVGSYATQLAKAFGADVTGVCSTAKMELVRSLGADKVVDYTRADPTAGPVKYDVIIDTGGTRSLRDLRRVLSADGTLVIVGGENGGRWLGGTDRQLRAMLLSLVSKQRLISFIAKEVSSDMATLAALAESGSLTPVVDATYPLADVPTALQHLQDGKARGKVAVTVAPDREEGRTR